MQPCTNYAQQRPFDDQNAVRFQGLAWYHSYSSPSVRLAEPVELFSTKYRY